MLFIPPEFGVPNEFAVPRVVLPIVPTVPPIPLQDEIGKLLVGALGTGLTSEEFGIVVLSGVGVVMVANGLIPLLVISVAPSGIAPPTMVDPLPRPVLDNPVAVPEVIEVDPQGNAVPDVVIALDVVPVPPPSKLEIPPLVDAPELESPVLLDTPLEHDVEAKGLSPPGLSSVAPSGMPDAVAPEVVLGFISVAPRGTPDVIPGPVPMGVVIPIPCAKAEPAPSRLVLMASTSMRERLIETFLRPFWTMFVCLFI
jgi:hypothetical protein